MAEDHRLRGPGGVVLRGEEAPQVGTDPEQGQGPIGDPYPGDPLRLVEPGHRDVGRAPDADVGQGPTLLTIGEVQCRRLAQQIQVEAWRTVPHRHQALGVRKGQWSEQHAVDHAEDRRVAADPEGEGEGRHDGEYGRTKELAEGLQEWL